MMLSTISHSHSHSMPSSYAPPHDPPPTMTASLAILPQRQPSTSPAVSLAQRPKLHINTQQLRTFGKGSSLRLDTLSAISPTIRNTFSNAYEASASASAAAAASASAPQPQSQSQQPKQLPQQTAGRPSKPRLSINSSFPAKPPQSNSNPPSSTTPSSASTSSTLTSASSSESATIAIPYKQPHNLVSILSNSPARLIIPRKMASARPLFPAEKKVSFRTPLEEEIKTVKFTLAHSDIESNGSTSTLSSVDAKPSSKTDSSSSSSMPKASLSLSTPSASNNTSPAGKSSTTAFASLETSPRPNVPRTGDKRDSSDSDSDSCPETPVAGRRKRRRDWHWTLGPLPSSTSSEKSTSGSTSDATASEDSH
ncbi:hypothetical protein B0J11DRAFT_333763 [Dendryphion nanum]|uniref:Uncharacterized protein n=1 Tax=Dendryphion nanum TaxID=256645 RepID=A0A9P9DK92_9PLEO|nr:hypothetical protein B0J11DRAFT_333763 [Dendryphion nanum]